MKRILCTCILLGLVACEGNDVAQAPPPDELTADVVGTFCNMYVAEHPGPKGQVFLSHQDKPLWFPSVRDTIAYLMLPEQDDEAVAVYVNDVAQITDWDRPEPGTWIRARDAWYVIGSDRTGGLGLPEVAPFSTEQAARDFSTVHGGTLMRLAEIPPTAIYDLASHAQPAGGVDTQ